jgi:hypothetical protein
LEKGCEELILPEKSQEGAHLYLSNLLFALLGSGGRERKGSELGLGPRF